MRTNVIALPSDQGNDAVQLYLLQQNTYPLSPAIPDTERSDTIRGCRHHKHH